MDARGASDSRRRGVAVVRVVLVLALSLAAAVPSVARASAAAASEAPRAIDPAHFDRSVSPAVDFYRFVNGGWMAAHPIPPGQSSWGTFPELRQRQSDLLLGLIEEIATDETAAPGSDRRKIRDFYLAAMDTAAIERRGPGPLRPIFARIDSIATPEDLAAVMGWLQLRLCNTGFRFYRTWDPQRSDRVIAAIDQYGSYTLPDRTAYLGTDSLSVTLRESYADHIERMMALAGVEADRARTAAEGVVRLEGRFARGAWSEEDMRDPKSTSVTMTLESLRARVPEFPWRRYFDELGLRRTGRINVVPAGYFEAFGRAVAETPLAEWRDYLKWCVVHAAAPMLSAPFAAEHFRFFGGVLTGAQEPPPRRQRVVEQMGSDSYLGWALGREYVRRQFPPEAKAAVLRMIGDIKDVFRSRLRALPWMSERTKRRAVEKLEKIAVKIGYPDVWPDLNRLEIAPDGYLENVLRCSAFFTARQVASVGRPADRREWGMTPQEVNAYYNPLQNEIVFPAGILRAPFFSETFDAAVNYGGIGCVIAHEFTHAFDDQGSRYDGDGTLADWWTAADQARFEEKKRRIVAQYSRYTVLDTLHVNGALTVGENIADLGGVTIAYDAYRRHARRAGPQPTLDGFTPDQRFFIAWAQIWRRNQTPEALTLQVRSSTTSPARWRVNGPLSNCDGFIAAFGLKEGDPMVFPRSERFSIW